MDDDATVDAGAVEAALLRQRTDPDDHDLGLIEESLRLTPDERIQRLKAWVNVARRARARPKE